MNYLDLFTPHHIATLSDWFGEVGKLCVRIEWPHRGQSGATVTVASIEELRDLIRQQTHPEIEIWILKQPEIRNSDYERLDDLTWVYTNSDRVMFLSVKKNRNYSEAYAKNPEKYKVAVRTWTET